VTAENPMATKPPAQLAPAEEISVDAASMADVEAALGQLGALELNAGGAISRAAALALEAMGRRVI
jgi:hypothetical protein